MHDTSKTKAQLIEELETLRQRVATTEVSQAAEGGNTRQITEEETINVIEAMADPLILFGLDGRFLFVNSALETMSGFERDELIGRHFDELLQEVSTEEEREKVRTTLRDGIQKGCTPPFEFTWVTRNGSKLAVSATASVLKDDKGRPRGLVATYRDITDQRRMEKALRESEERFRALFEGCPDAICLVDPVSGKILDANPLASELVSKPPEDIIGMHYSELHPPPIRERAQESFKSHLEDRGPGQAIESALLASDGKQVPVELLAQIIQVDGLPVLMGTFRDITQRKHSEEELRQSEERYRLVAQNSPDIITIINPDNSFRYISPAVERILGYTPEEVIEHMGFDHVHPEDRTPTLAAYARLAEDPNCLLNVQYRLRRKDGSYRYVEAVGRNCLANPALRAIFLNVRDITARTQLEEQLRSSEERYRLLVQNSSDFTATFDSEGRIRYVSPAVERMLGYKPEELDGQGRIDLAHPEDMPSVLDFMIRCVNSPGEPTTAQYRMRHKDGSWRYVEAVGNNQLDNPVLRAVVMNIRDITDRKKTEEALEKTERLESLSVLCGGIAHDFNNILTAVLTNISMAQMYGELEEDIEKMLADAEKASLRGRGLTQQLLTFAKGGEPIKRAVSIATLLKDTIAFALSGSNVRCEPDLPEDLWHVDADEGQIGQVIQNVILNADQAMPGGGVIRLRAENATIPEHDPLPLEPGNYVKISIMDQGIGIPEEHLKKVFDPFFTTKQKGSGLGLSTSFSIVRRHNGTLQVESRLGGGTKIHVYLPASPEGRTKRGATGDASYRGEERVLLIDDDETLRRSIGKALDRFGYHVEHASEGAEGIAAYQKARTSGRPIDVVVMDLTIPGGMGGKEAAQELLRIDPDANLIVSSGYSTDPIMSNFRAHGFRAVISKPYRIEDLGQTLRQVLTGE